MAEIYILQGMSDEIIPPEEAQQPSEAPPAPKKKLSAGSGGSGGSGKVAFNGFDILLSSPCDHLNTPNANAFDVAQTTETGVPLYALVCEIGLPLRTGNLDSIKGVQKRGLITLFDWGFVDWKPDSSRRLVLLYEKPGDRFIPDIQAPPKMKDKEIIKTVAEPIVSALQELHSRNIVHRNIRPDNLFYNRAGDGVVLGDYLSVLPGRHQPVWMETIEMGMTNPAGRGAGTVTDDIYNLGTLLLYFSIGEVLGGKMDEFRLIMHKINEGSYIALLAKHGITRTMEVGCRSMLYDDVITRATLGDVIKWLDAGRLQTKPEPQQRIASRPFPFMGDQHLSIRSLAYAMSRDITAAAELVMDRSLDRWIRRSFGYEKMADDLMAAAGSTANATAANDAQKTSMVARVLLVIDPLAPIRYRHVSMNLDGIGSLIAASLTEMDKLADIQDLILKQIPNIFLQTRKHTPEVNSTYMSMLGELSKLANRRGPAFSIERMMYEISPEMPCLSPSVRKKYIMNPKELMMGLDEVSRMSNRPNTPIDKDIVAFLAARLKGDIKSSEFVAFGLNQEPAAFNLAAARLLSKVQMLADIGPLKSLNVWMADLLKPVIQKYKNLKRKKAMEKRMEEATSSGSIARVIMVADNEAERLKDEQEFQTAVADYSQIKAEIDGIEKLQNNKKEIAQFKGEQVSVLVAMIIAVLICFMLVSVEFS